VSPIRPLSPLELYRQELLRWNLQISLVSRERPGSRVTALLELCHACRRALSPAIEEIAPVTSADFAAGRFGYADLGSGGGLPGIPWRLADVNEGPPAETWLVEPREKRAWFLERVIRQLGLADTAVSRGRWGEEQLGPPDHPVPPVWLLSLMALRLADPEIVSGWERAVAGRPGANGATLLIARLRPAPEPASITDELREELALPATATLVPLPEAGAALLLSAHQVPARH
jgi:hypothetical protein